MTSLRCFETPIVIDSKNYKNDEIQKKLEIIHSTKDLTNRDELWKEEEKRHKTNIRSIQKEKREWYKLHRITAGLNSGYVGNLFPDYLLKLYAPLFFKNYPDGKIWFLPFHELDRQAPIIDEREIAEKYKPDNHPFGFSQSYGINFLSTLDTIALEISMFLRFPYFQGTITGSMSGLVCFLINKPINMYEDHMNLNTFLLEKTKWFYTDSNANLYSNPRSIFQKLNLKEFSRYFDWYISKLNNLYDFVQSINGLEKRHLLGFTIARICLDTYLIQIIEPPYLRKMIFFTLLDKYENLIKEFGSRKGDTIIWRELLSLTFFEGNLKDLAKKTPRVLQILQGVRFNLKHTTRHVLHSKYDVRVNVKTHENEAIDFLRAYRNSHHGYFLTRNRSQRFLEHTGEIPNYLPDYALDLWHIFLADPQEFVNKLK